MKKRLFISLICIFSTILCFADRITVGNFCYDITLGSSEASLVENNSNEYSGDVVIPSSFTYQGKEYQVTKIGANAFYCCLNLTSVKIPDGVNEIGDGAFTYDVKIKSIAIPNSVEKMGNGVFCGCSILERIVLEKGNKHFVFKDNMLFSADGKILYQVLQITENLVVPEGVTEIKDEAVSMCSELTSVSLPSSLTYIGKKAFFNVFKMRSISIPQNVSYIGEAAFGSCNSYLEISLEGNNSFYKMENGILLSKDGSLLLHTSRNIDDVVSIPNTVVRIGAWALSEHANEKLVVPDNVQTIGEYAFLNLIHLSSITLGSSIKEIEQCAFWGCYNITSFVLRATTPPATSNVKFSTEQLEATLVVPKGCLNVYKNSTYDWSKFANIVEGDVTGVDSVINSSDNTPTTIYDANGMKRQSLAKGLNIIRMANGSIRKVLK